MIPEGNPNGRVARKSGRDPKFKETFTIRCWKPLSLQHLLPFIGTFEDVQVEVRVWAGVFEPMQESPEPRVGFDCLFSFFLLFFLFRIFVVVFASAPAFASICSLSLSLTLSLCLCLSLSLSLALSLSLLPLDVSVYLSIFSARFPSNVNAKKQRQVQS
jgi:hypothetical protein